VSQLRDAYTVQFAYYTHNRRTVAEIQGNIMEKGERNLFSRIVHARNDKEVMAAWRSDLNRVLHVFNVCSVCSVRQSLTAPLQTELAINTHIMVADIHRNALTGQEGADGQHHSVNATRYSSTT